MKFSKLRKNSKPVLSAKHWERKQGVGLHSIKHIENGQKGMKINVRLPSVKHIENCQKGVKINVR